jgi:hypothetical protein
MMDLPRSRSRGEVAVTPWDLVAVNALSVQIPPAAAILLDPTNIAQPQRPARQAPPRSPICPTPIQARSPTTVR